MSDDRCYRDIQADNENLHEQIKHFRRSLDESRVTIAVLRRQVDDLTAENTRLKLGYGVTTSNEDERNGNGRTDSD